MSLDAKVRCRCWEEGRTTTPPPCPPDLIGYDEDGHLWLTLPFDGNEGQHDDFQDWLLTSCAHENAALVDLDMPKNRYRLFQQMVDRLGWDRFPTLRARLPDGDDVTPAAASAAALRELDAFDASGDLGHTLVLADPATSEVAYERVDAYRGVFFLSGRTGLDMGVDERGLFVADRDGDRVAFRSAEFEQRSAGDDVELADVATGQRFVFHHGLSRVVPWPDGRWQDDRGRPRTVLYARLRLERRAVTPADYADVTAKLREALTASVATGNPVEWC